MDSQNVWDRILGRVETKINRHSFYTWFKPSSFLSESGDQVRVRVPNPVFRDWLTKHYAGLINEALSEIDRPMVKIEFVADTQSGALPTLEEASPAIPPEEAALAEASLFSPGAPEGERLGAVCPPRPTAALPGTRRPASASTRATRSTRSSSGRRNQFADAASRAVAEAPARSYNPLYIYGGVGLGKTHLMHAIGHYVLRNNPHFKLTYISDRAVHERDDQRGQDRPHHRLPRAVPQRRRPARRRHPVPRGQGGHPERVLPHLQRAVRRPEADRPEQRLPAATRSRRSRSACGRASSGA